MTLLSVYCGSLQVWLLTWVEALVDTPLCFLVFVGYVQGWHSRRALELVLCTSHFLGTVFFMGTELHDGLQVRRTCLRCAHV